MRQLLAKRGMTLKFVLKRSESLRDLAHVGHHQWPSFSMARLLAVRIDLPVEQEPVPNDAVLAKLMRIAREHGLMSYDAAYVEVAQLSAALRGSERRSVAGRRNVSSDRRRSLHGFFFGATE